MLAPNLAPISNNMILVPVCETVIRHSAILSDLHQSCFFSTIAIIHGHQSQVQRKIYALNHQMNIHFNNQSLRLKLTAVQNLLNASMLRSSSFLRHA